MTISASPLFFIIPNAVSLFSAVVVKKSQIKVTTVHTACHINHHTSAGRGKCTYSEFYSVAESWKTLKYRTTVAVHNMHKERNSRMPPHARTKNFVLSEDSCPVGRLVWNRGIVRSARRMRDNAYVPPAPALFILRGLVEHIIRYLPWRLRHEWTERRFVCKQRRSQKCGSDPWLWII